MASILARNVSVIFPLIGPDGRFSRKAETETSVGGQILEGRTPGILAIDDVSLDLQDGDRLGIFGRNGSGKTTLLRVLGGIYPPTSGTLEVEGSVAGMYSLSLGINKEATGLQNIQFKGLLHGMSRREVDEMVPEIAAFSELGDYLHLPMKTYSSGMVMRLVFATASMMKPDILLLDEWVSAGDQAFRDKANEHLDRILEVSKIVVIASQNEARLRDWSNKLISLDGGRAKDPGAPSAAAFRPDPEKLQRFRVLSNLQFLDQALEMLEDVWPEERAPVPHYQQKAGLLSRLGDAEGALAFQRQALSLDPDNPALHNAVGRTEYRVGNPQEGFDRIMMALHLSNGAVGDIKTLQKCAEVLGRPKDMPDFRTYLKDEEQ